MSRTAVESSGDVNVSVTSHLSNLPVMATDASTSNFIVLPTGVISKTGTCAQVADENMASIKTRRIVNLIRSLSSTCERIAGLLTCIDGEPQRACGAAFSDRSK